MSANFTTIMYGTLEDLDSILDREEMNEQELRAALQRVLTEVRLIGSRLDRWANLPTISREHLEKYPRKA